MGINQQLGQGQGSPGHGVGKHGKCLAAGVLQVAYGYCTVLSREWMVGPSKWASSGMDALVGYFNLPLPPNWRAKGCDARNHGSWCQPTLELRVLRTYDAKCSVSNVARHVGIPWCCGPHGHWASKLAPTPALTGPAPGVRSRKTMCWCGSAGKLEANEGRARGRIPC